jgi:hypothetical protein
MATLVRVEARDCYRLFLEFSDGVAGEVDVRPRLFGPMFEPLLDAALFAKVELDEFGAPSWPNGADLAPDALHEELKRTARSQPRRG